MKISLSAGFAQWIQRRGVTPLVMFTCTAGAKAFVGTDHNKPRSNLVMLPVVATPLVELREGFLNARLFTNLLGRVLQRRTPF